MSFVGLRVAHALKVPVIHTEHGSDFVSGVSPFVGFASRTVDHTLGRYVLRRSSAVLAISASVQAFVRKLSGRNSTLFLNAITTDRFAGSTPSSRRGNLVFLGRIVPGKGWERAIETLEVLHGEGRHVHLHLIGDGPDMGRLRRRVEGSPASAHITVHGFLDSATIAGYLRGGVLLNPTTLSEGFQTTLLEAIAAQGAVVSTPVNAAEYLAGIGANVNIVAEDKPEAWVAATRVLLDAGWNPASPELVETFDWSARSREYAALLSSLVR
jgi:glycosyltransferase involved in cell wall biosynthesis